MYNLKDPSEIERLLTSTNPPPDPNNISLPTWEQTKCSVRENGHIIAYAIIQCVGVEKSKELVPLMWKEVFFERFDDYKKEHLS